MPNRVVVAPAVEPITLAEAKSYLRVTDSHQDDEITFLIAAAREYIETYCGLSMITQTREQTYDNFQSGFQQQLELQYGPVQSIESVKYLDRDDVLQTVDVSGYTLLNWSNVFSLGPMPLTSWPYTSAQSGSVRIRYIAGYEGAGSPIDLRANVPPMLLLALRSLLAHLYEARESPIGTMAATPAGLHNLLAPFRAHMF